MRIAVVHSFYSSAQPSGENTVVLQQVEALRSAGHDVHLIARHTDEESERAGYAARAALTVASGRGSSPADELSRLHPDVVHLHNTFPNFGTQWLENWGDRTVATLHNFRTVCAAGTLFREGHDCRECLVTPVLPAIQHRCYRGSRGASLPLAVASAPWGPLRKVGRRSAAVVALNDEAAAIMMEQLGRPVTVLPNFTAQAPEVPGVERSGWVYVGRLAAEKGILELIESWPRGKRLDVIGDGPLRSQVASLASRRNDNGIRVLGLMERGDLLKRLPYYHGLLLPSLWPEGLPTVVLEALSNGTPIVASDRVSASSFLRGHGVAVTVRTPLNTRELEGALASVCGNADMAKAARGLHATTYSQASWLTGAERIYDQILGRVRRP